MHAARKRRLLLITFIGVLVAVAISLVLYALRGNINWFFSPTEVAMGKAPYLREVRVGGMVKHRSVRRDKETLNVTFVLTDSAQDVLVRYHGILPDLFREGQGVVVRGVIERNREITAKEVLAKHSATYMPKRVREAMDAAKKHRMAQQPTH